MIINEQGTFYVEGEYAQGDTILNAGDWELRANGSKNAFAYSPETFVRRNLLNWSEDFGNSYWSKSRVTVDKSQSFLDGSPATALIETSETGEHHIQRNLTFINEGSTYSSSIYIKNLSGDRFLGLFLFRATSPFSSYGDFQVNPVTGGVDVSSGGISHEVEALSEGWYRIKFVSLIPVTNINIRFRLRANGVFSYQGNGTSGIYISGAQLEQGSTPSDYQRTTTHVPRPFAIKDELVTNGDFKTSDDLWVKSGDGTFVIGDQVATVTATSSSAYRVTYEVGVQSGVTYQFIQEAPTVASGTPSVSFRLGYGPLTAELLGSTGYSNNLSLIATSGTFTPVNSTIFITYLVSGGAGSGINIANISLKEVQQPLTLGNGNHKDFRYYPKTLSQNETEALTA